MENNRHGFDLQKWVCYSFKGRKEWVISTIIVNKDAAADGYYINTDLMEGWAQLHVEKYYWRLWY
jgi:hypothetical protein